MDLVETLQAISVSARAFKGGTAITSENHKEAAYHGIMFEELLQIAKRKGATPYEIMRAYKGEIIGSSFTE